MLKVKWSGVCIESDWLGPVYNALITFFTTGIFNCFFFYYMSSRSLLSASQKHILAQGTKSHKITFKDKGVSEMAYHGIIFEFKLTSQPLQKMFYSMNGIQSFYIAHLSLSHDVPA